ncbi:MAG: CAP domain-containing protein [Bacteroidota bacterium]
MYNLIKDTREKKGLPRVELSSSLSRVAELHVIDLHENEPFDKRCNPHSWSDQGTWKECCYKEDHSNPECMWKKPSEITDYKGDGYEIVAFWKSGSDPNLDISPETALRLWLESPGHSNVIFNKRTFKQVEWNAVGVGIYGNYAAVWFGVEEDTALPLQKCSD